MQECGNRLQLVVGQLLRTAQQAGFDLHAIRHATLDALDMRHAAVMGDIGRLAGPWRNRAETRNHDKFVAIGRCREWLAISQHCIEARHVVVAGLHRSLDEVQIAPGDTGNCRIDLLKLRQ